MSLELAIQQNTEAILALTAAIAAQNKPTTTPADVMDASVVAQLTAQAEKPKKAKLTVKVEEPISTTDALPATEPVKAVAPVAEVKVTLADLQAEGKKLLDAGRQAELKQVVTDLKGTKLSLLPASDYPAALKALKALTAGL